MVDQNIEKLYYNSTYKKVGLHKPLSLALTAIDSC